MQLVLLKIPPLPLPEVIPNTVEVGNAAPQTVA